MLDIFKKLNVFKRVEELKAKSESDRKITQQIFGGLIDAGLTSTDAMEAIDSSLQDIEARISVLEKRVGLLQDRANAKPALKSDGFSIGVATKSPATKKAKPQTKPAVANKPRVRKTPSKAAKAK